MRSNHNQLHCEKCDLYFKEDLKLKMHLCKVTVKNPTFGTLYTKDWYDANGCTQIFCRKRNKGIIWLHNKSCSKSNPCAVYDDINAEEDDKVCEFEHLNIKCFLENGEILWEQIIHECRLTDIKKDF